MNQIWRYRARPRQLHRSALLNQDIRMAQSKVFSSAKGWKAQSIIIAALAVLLLPAALYVLRVPVGFVLLLILIPLCPCISSECGNCSCDSCVYRVLIGILLILLAIPLSFYFVWRTK